MGGDDPRTRVEPHAVPRSRPVKGGAQSLERTLPCVAGEFGGPDAERYDRALPRHPDAMVESRPEPKPRADHAPLGTDENTTLRDRANFVLGNVPKHVRGALWWAVKFCRFELGELDEYDPTVRRLPDDAVILPSEL